MEIWHECLLDEGMLCYFQLESIISSLQLELLNLVESITCCRRYFGHKPTIRPNAKKLYKMFTDRNNMTWEEFSSQVQKQQIGFMGDPMEVKPGRGEFHENPSACICEDTNVKAREDVTIPRSPAMIFEEDTDSADDGTRKSSGEVTDRHIIEDEQYWFDTDYMENEIGRIQSIGGATISLR